MPQTFSYQLLSSTSSSSGASSDASSRPYSSYSTRPYLGFGLVVPFRRDLKGDFAADSDLNLVVACVEQVLGVQATGMGSEGELPWRPEFGSLVHTLRHSNNDGDLQDRARVFVIQALGAWEPRYSVKKVNATRVKSSPSATSEDALSLSVLGDVIAANVPGNQVLIPNVSVNVVLP